MVEALTASARDRGADVHVVSGPVIPKERPDEIPPAVLDAYGRADVLFAHYPSLKREALHPHFPGESRVRVPNRARTVSLMSSEWAGFPYSVQRALATTLDTLSAPGKAWRVTSPNGTDVRGTFGSRESTVAQAYFVEDEGGRARRNFPGGVHSPVVAVATEGVIVADHIAGFGGMPHRLRLELKEGRVVSIEGGDPDGPMHEALGGTDGFIDSWHAGVNPKTIVPVARADNPVQWYSYSHCSPMIVHFPRGTLARPRGRRLFRSDHRDRRPDGLRGGQARHLGRARGGQCRQRLRDGRFDDGEYADDAKLTLSLVYSVRCPPAPSPFGRGLGVRDLGASSRHSFPK